MVFFATLSEAQGSVRLADGSLTKEIERWRAEPGDSEIAIGGTTLAAEAASVGLIDAYRVRVYPVPRSSPVHIVEMWRRNTWSNRTERRSASMNLSQPDCRYPEFRGPGSVMTRWCALCAVSALAVLTGCSVDPAPSTPNLAACSGEVPPGTAVVNASRGLPYPSTTLALGATLTMRVPTPDTSRPTGSIENAVCLVSFRQTPRDETVTVRGVRNATIILSVVTHARGAVFESVCLKVGSGSVPLPESPAASCHFL